MVSMWWWRRRREVKRLEPTDLVKAAAGVRQREGRVKKTRLNPPKGEENTSPGGRKWKAKLPRLIDHRRPRETEEKKRGKRGGEVQPEAGAPLPHPKRRSDTKNLEAKGLEREALGLREIYDNSTLSFTWKWGQQKWRSLSPVYCGLDGRARKTTWPEVVGLPAEEAERKIKEEMPGVRIQVVLPNCFVTMDFNQQRVRLHVDSSGKVARPPKIG